MTQDILIAVGFGAWPAIFCLGAFVEEQWSRRRAARGTVTP